MRNFYLLLILLPAILPAQQYNAQWVFGYGANFNNDFGFASIDFSPENVTLSPYAEFPGFFLGNNGSFLCSKDGVLELMTDNCSIRDKNFNIIAGGDTLTPGETWGNYCNPAGTYPANQVSLFLPEMNNDSVIYLLHKDANLSDVFQDVVTNHFYLSVIIRKPDGTFYHKSRTTIKSGNLMIDRLTACRNSADTKWWTFSVNYNTNQFYFYEIGGDSLLSQPVITHIGMPILGSQAQISQAAFSPDGKTLAINNCRDAGVFLYDFDPETGKLSNFRNKIYQNSSFTGQGVCFSPNNRFLYLTAGNKLYQLDVPHLNEPDAVVFIDSVDLRDETNWPIGADNMYSGPDCRIYIGPGSTTYYIHVLHQPDLKGTDCKLEKNAIRSPVNLYFDLPNTINYDPDGMCDGSLGWGIVENEEPEILTPFKLYPNPVSDKLFISPEVPGMIRIFDATGRLIMDQPISSNGLDMSSFRTGIYFYQLWPDNGPPQVGTISVIHP